MKSLKKILIEAVVVGLSFLIIYCIVNRLLKSTLSEYISSDKNVFYVLLVLSAGLLHIVFEYTGLNKYYVDNYYK
jgi:uncharacterized membrane protein YozB (DUF420 family)